MLGVPSPEREQFLHVHRVDKERAPPVRMNSISQEMRKKEYGVLVKHLIWLSQKELVERTC